MTADIEQIKKKIIYRSNYRGTKEMDKLLGAFVKKYINDLSDDDLVKLEKLLDIDDSNLYNFLNGLELSLIHISEPTRRTPISYAVFCLKKKK